MCGEGREGPWYGEGVYRPACVWGCTTLYMGSVRTSCISGPAYIEGSVRGGLRRAVDNQHTMQPFAQALGNASNKTAVLIS